MNEFLFHTNMNNWIEFGEQEVGYCYQSCLETNK